MGVEYGASCANPWTKDFERDLRRGSADLAYRLHIFPQLLRNEDDTSSRVA